MTVLTRPAEVIKRLCIIGAAGSLSLSAATVLSGGGGAFILLAMACVGSILVCLALLRLGRIVLAADLLCLTLLLGATAGSALTGGIYSVQVLGLAVFPVLVGLFRGASALPVAGVVVMVSLSVLGAFSQPPSQPPSLPGVALAVIGVGLSSGAALWLTMRRLASIHDELSILDARQQAQEDSLSEQQALLTALGEGIPGGIAIVARSTGRLRWRSPGWSAEGETLSELFAPEHAPAIQRILTEGEAPEPLPRDERWIQVCLSPAARADHMVVILLDVTDEHRARLALRERALALSRTERLASVGRLADGLCHEIHNTLTTLSHLSWLAGQKLSIGSEASEDLAEIEGAVRRASGITRPLLPLAENLPEEREVVELRGLLTDTRRMLEKVAAPGAWLHLEMEPGEHLISSSAGLMEELLINLVANGRQAMQGRGGITIRLSQTSKCVWLEVSDSGIGMDAETLRLCREMFYTTRESGSGLGLAVVERVVRKAGGRMDLSSSPGVGTTVLMTFPPASKAPEQISVEPATVLSGARRRVLVIDDSSEIRRIVCAVLAQAGFEPVEVSSADQAIAAVKVHPVDLLISDVIMPDMDGAQLARLLRQDIPELPVLLITGYAAQALEKARLSGAMLLKKPFTPEDLIEAVQRTLHPDPFAKSRPNLVEL